MKEIVKEIRKKQDELIKMINTTFDDIVNEVSKLDGKVIDRDDSYDLTFPLTNTTGFKGKKVIGIKLSSGYQMTPTWKKVVEEILKDAIKDDNCRNKMNELRDKMLGRVRKRVSGSSEGMKSPLGLDDDLYVETHYDTETLMNMLLQILDYIGYDYSMIEVDIKR